MTRKFRTQGKTLVCDFWIDLEKFKSFQQPVSTGCINWTGPKHNQGYGFVFAIDTTVNDKKMLTAHKVAAMIREKHRIPAHTFVIHTCSNMACVNPDHLLLGDRTDLTAVMRKNGRTLAGKNTVKPIKRQNRKYRHTIPELYFMVDNKDDVKLVAKTLKVLPGHARDYINRALSYKWLIHFDRQGNLKPEFKEIYE